MLFKAGLVSMISVATISLSGVGCGSTQTRDDSVSSVSDEMVYASSAEVRVDGLGCPMCAESITLMLGGIDAVESSRVDLSNGIVVVDLDPSTGVSAAQLRSAVDDGGFTFRSVAFEK